MCIEKETLVERIKKASKYSDFLFLSQKDLIKDIDQKTPTEVFTFPLYKEEENNKNFQYEKNINVNYDSKLFDKLKQLEGTVNIDSKKINDDINKSYENIFLTTEKPKYSVSEIKHREQIFDESVNKFLSNKKSVEEYTKDDDLWIENEANTNRVDGSLLGTLFHSFMEHYDFTTNIKDYIKNDAIGKNFEQLTPYITNIEMFLSSKLGKEVKKAKDNNKLYREQKFMIELPLNKIKNYMYANNPDLQKNELNVDDNVNVIVQGVIDAFFINENNNIILIDYKTDGILKQNVSKEDLIKYYKIQLEIYAESLTKILNKELYEKYIYSFALNEEISI